MRVLGAGVVALAAAVAVAAPSGAARGATRGVSARLLALMPLPRAEFGATAAGLPVAQDSGVVTNGDAASNANGNVSAAQLGRLGQETGYMLDYGALGERATGVSEVQTSVELYSSAQAATRGLAFWRGDETELGALRADGISIVLTPFAVAGLGAGSAAYAGDLKLKSEPRIYGVDIYFQSGELVAQVSVNAESRALLRSLAVGAAAKLNRRIHEVLAGQLSGPAAPLPRPLKPGPPPNGPNPEALALTPGDLNATGTITRQGFQVAAGAESEYGRYMSPIGPFASLTEQVIVYGNPTIASYAISAFGGQGSAERMWQAFVGKGAPLSKVRPKLVSTHDGDQSAAVLGVVHAVDGKNIYAGFITIRIGSTIEVIGVGAPLGVTLFPSALVQLTSIAAAQAQRGLNALPVA